MDINIRNFKGIKEFDYPSMTPTTILTGVNSGGKTSFIHFLLMIKQSIELGTHNRVLVLNGPYVSLGMFEDILNTGDRVSFSMNFYKDDDEKVFKMLSRQIFNRNKRMKSLRNSDGFFDNSEKRNLKMDFDKICIKMEFREKSSKVVLSNLEVTLVDINSSKHQISFEEYRTGNNYKYETNSLLFTNPYYSVENKKNVNEEFKLSGKTKLIIDNLLPSNPLYDISDPISYSIIKYLFKVMNNFFESITYLGPLREEPHALYLKTSDIITSIGKKGENTISIMSENETKEILCPLYENGNYLSEEKTLIEGVNYWLCHIFQLAKKIEVNSLSKGVKEVLITNFNSVKTPISSVGFGISQVLPIIVEGLVSANDTTLILEQPEIHLHPKIQSMLFDFLYGLTVFGKKVIIETHSDHLINRLRLRIVEDSTNKIGNQTNLFFIENNYAIKNITIDSFGIIESWPEGFFDQNEIDTLAILKAQTSKYISQMKED